MRPPQRWLTQRLAIPAVATGPGVHVFRAAQKSRPAKLPNKPRHSHLQRFTFALHTATRYLAPTGRPKGGLGNAPGNQHVLILSPERAAAFLP